MKKTVALCVALAALISLVAGQSNLPTFPNIGYLGAGYDYYYGCPQTTVAADSPDPGYRQFIFDLTQYGKHVTPDQKYRIPDGTDVQLCSECSVEWKTKNISGSTTYQKILNDSVSGNFNFIVAQFSASYDYSHVNYYTTSFENVFTEAYTDCCVYKGQIQTFNAPPFSRDFLNGLKFMPTVYNSDTASFFHEFIGAFGTHYIGSITMGGRFGQRSRISANSWKRLISSGLSWSVGAGFSAQGASAAFHVMSNDQKSYAAQFSNLTESQSLFSLGGELPATFKVQDWIASSKTDPMPLTAKIHLLSDLLTTMYFPNDPEINEKSTALLNGLRAYCGYLLQKGALKSCQAPTDFHLDSLVSQM